MIRGTVEIPASNIYNWIGGVRNAATSGNLMGQGGIPSKGIAEGGQVKWFQLEHVWVEAYVDFEPGRGTQNGQKDSWIPLDPSYKQYDYSAGMDLQQQAPFDAQALIDNIQSKATINDSEGWVQNLPTADLEQALADYQQQLTDYLDNQNPNATVGDVLGLQQVKILEPRPLAAGLPYHHIVTQRTFTEVPNNLRHRFKYQLGTALYGTPNTPFIQIDQPTVKLAGKTLALSFSPATQDDQDIIESYLPQPDPQTGEINPQDFPKTLPGYLINLNAEFSIDGETIATANAGNMGEELYETIGLWSPGQGWNDSVNHPTAGEYQAIGLDLQGASPQYAAQLQQRLNDTKSKLESNDEQQLNTLTKQDLVGDLLEATIFSYFAMNDVQDDIGARQANIVSYRAPSYGKFSTTLTTSYFFGQPRNVTATGLMMDVDRLAWSLADKDNERENEIRYVQLTGSRASAMEHLVPEKMFSTADAPAKGISAVKALSIATAEGQKIWTITKDNLSVALQNIQLQPDTEKEIVNAVNSGKIVTVHEKTLSFNGWVGEGYIILDPDTGAGAYKIAGGGNGGALVEFIAVLASFMLVTSVAALSLLAAPGFISLMVYLWVVINFKYWVAGLGAATDKQSFTQNNALALIGNLVGFLPKITIELSLTIFFTEVFAFLMGFLP